MNELTIAATTENIETVIEFVNEQLKGLGCPTKAQRQIDIAVDELFGNIARYAYAPETGDATVRMEVFRKPLSVEISFVDKGTPFNPLEVPAPDTGLAAAQREAGGLGIFISKNCMDEIVYTYKDGQNILSVKKRL